MDATAVKALRGLSHRDVRGVSIETRIIGHRIELHASHARDGERFISRADRLEDAAEALVELIERTSPTLNDPSSSPARLGITLRRAAARMARSIGQAGW
jgi:hypothetical protein